MVVLANNQSQLLTAPLSNPGVLVVAPVIGAGEGLTSLGTSALIFEKHTSPKNKHTSPKTNMDTQNDGLEKVDGGLHSNLAIFGIYVRFQGSSNTGWQWIIKIHL